MLFMDTLAEQIALGKKTQTRRPAKPGEQLLVVDGVKRVVTAAGRLKHAVGSIRKIGYGRGKPTRWWNPALCKVLPYESYLSCLAMYGNAKTPNALRDEGFVPFKYEILDIREEADVRDITHEDSIAEGFESVPKYGFLHTWTMLYDDTFAYRFNNTLYDPNRPNYCPLWLHDRPDYKYGPAFAYTFKVHVD